jgi:hypothetical protein
VSTRFLLLVALDRLVDRFLERLTFGYREIPATGFALPRQKRTTLSSYQLVESLRSASIRNRSASDGIAGSYAIT